MIQNTRIINAVLIAFLAASPPLAVASDTLLAVYCLPLETTTMDSGPFVGFGEYDELEFAVTIANEEGNVAIEFQGDLASSVNVSLTYEDREILVSELQSTWRLLNGPSSDRTDAVTSGEVKPKTLLPGEFMRADLRLTRQNGLPFAFGNYQLTIGLLPTMIETSDGTAWWHRAGRGATVFELRKPKTDDELIAEYTIAASKALREGDMIAANAFYSKIGEISPSNPTSFARLGLTYYWMRDYEKAIPYLENALDSTVESGTRSTIPRALATCYLATDQDDLAIEVLAREGGYQYAIKESERILKTLDSPTGGGRPGDHDKNAKRE